ncbi:MAG TPA: fatty acid desaturase [Terriglobia bacterium]|nr:fatty acid desaturase [Terriglobia bacterium]
MFSCKTPFPHAALHAILDLDLLAPERFKEAVASRVMPLMSFCGTTMPVTSTAGVWLFYVQHQFERANWQPHGEWKYSAAAVKGSSSYKLPRLLQWFSGNIGYLSIHHLNSWFPNCNLEKCHNEGLMLQQIQSHYSALQPEASFSFLTGLR